MKLIGKGTGISKAQLREQKMKDMLSGMFKPQQSKPIKAPKPLAATPVRVRNAPVYQYDLTIYTTRGTLRKNQSPLDRSYKSDTHVKVKETGELVTKAEWNRREDKRRYQIRMDSMRCVRCGRAMDRSEFITCTLCCSNHKKD